VLLAYSKKKHASDATV